MSLMRENQNTLSREVTMSDRRERAPLAERMRRRAGALIVDSFFRGITAAGKLHPMARPARHNVEVLRDIRYRDGELAEHQLDIYRPATGNGPWPVVLYVHGGGFRILSKDTHWIMALAFARRGFLVVNISYRLAPRHPFPAAIEDTCTAFAWLARNVESYGGDLDRVVLAGESAGANLVTSLALATVTRRPEPWAREVFDAGVVPRAVLPACGILQVSDIDRFRKRKMPSFIRDRLVEVSEAYLGRTQAESLDLADPLVVLERNEPTLRELPPFFAAVGTWDPILDDTRRLKAALDRRGVSCEARYYEREPHAFHALVFRPNARRCWQDTFEFLDRCLRPSLAVAKEAT
jgi:acetyl esterase